MNEASDASSFPVPCCTYSGEDAAFWLPTEPGMSDEQLGGVFLMSLLRGMTSAMRREPRGGVSCDISPTSIMALLGEARGVAVGPVVYAHNCCGSPVTLPSCVSKEC